MDFSFRIINSLTFISFINGISKLIISTINILIFYFYSTPSIPILENWKIDIFFLASFLLCFLQHQQSSLMLKTNLPFLCFRFEHDGHLLKKKCQISTRFFHFCSSNPCHYFFRFVTTINFWHKYFFYSFNEESINDI